MTQQGVLSKAELLDALRSGEREVVARLGALSADQFEQGRYENGWNGRQILAHIASMEWTYPRLIDVAKAAATPEASEKPGQKQAADSGATGGLPTRSFRGGNLSYNDRQVEKRAQMSVEELLTELRENRATTIASVAQADESLFAVPIRSAGGITGPLAMVIHSVAVLHTQIHLNDIVGG